MGNLKCSICGSEFGFFSKQYITLDGPICQKCVNKIKPNAGVLYFKDKKISDLGFTPIFTDSSQKEVFNFSNYNNGDVQKLENILFQQYNFVPTAIIPFKAGSYPKRNLYIDDNLGAFYMPSFIGKIIPLQIIKFEDVNEISLVEDNSVVSSSGTGAFVGAMLGGIAGAVIGSSAGSGAYCRHLNIEVFTKFPETPRISYEFLKCNTERIHAKFIYPKKFADNAFAELRSRVIAKQKTEQDSILKNSQIPNNDFISQIKELADLKEKGILNEEEFLKAKEKLLK